MINKIDFHMHLGTSIYEDFNIYEEELNCIAAMNLKKAIIITPTYMHNNDIQASGLWTRLKRWWRLRTKRLVTISKSDNPNTFFHVTVPFVIKTNQIISDLLSKHHILGLCGISIHRSDAVEIAKKCINMPNIIGIKLRNFELEEKINGRIIPDASFKKRFEELIQLAHINHSVVLAHFVGHTDRYLDGDPDQTRMLVSIMNRYPNAKLVIAHSGVGSFVGLNGLEYIGNYYAENVTAPRNIYIDICKAFTMAGIGISWDGNQYIHNAVWSDAQEYIKAWKIFGIDRVLYGSAHGCDNHIVVGRHPDELSIADCPYLTESEKNKIYHENAENLINKCSRPIQSLIP